MLAKAYTVRPPFLAHFSLTNQYVFYLHTRTSHITTPHISLPIPGPVEWPDFGGVYSGDWARAVRCVRTRSMGSYVEGSGYTYVRGVPGASQAEGRGECGDGASM